MDSTAIPRDHCLPNFKKSDTPTEDALRVPPPSPADPPTPEAIFKREVGLAQLQLGRLKRHLQKVSTDGRLQTRQRMLERAIREQSGMISELMVRMPQNRQPTKRGATRYISGIPAANHRFLPTTTEKAPPSIDDGTQRILDVAHREFYLFIAELRTLHRRRMIICQSQDHY